MKIVSNSNKFNTDVLKQEVFVSVLFC